MNKKTNLAYVCGVISLLMLAMLACTLSSSDENVNVSGARTPTAISISDSETATGAAGPTQRPTTTAVFAPPTRQPTLLPTPLQFNTPVSNVAVPPPVSNNSNTGNPASSGGEIAASGGDPAAGAPQSNGFYFPNSIVYSSGGSLRAVGRDGSGGGVIGSGDRGIRSLNGLFVASASGGVTVVRPDGQRVVQGSGQTTLPTWSRDGSTAYFGSGNNLIRYRNGSIETVASLNGNISVVEFSPDSGTVLFANQNQVKMLHGDGNISTRWDSGSELVVNGPYWTMRGENLGVYFELNNGRRIWVGGDLSEITDPNEHLQLLSPANQFARVYVRANNGGSLTLVAAWPGASDIEFVAPTLADVSWSPDGSQLVFASPDGSLILLDTASGARSTIASGGARYPLCTTPHYTVRN